VYSIDSTIKSKKERDKIIEDFKKDKHGIMCNVGVLTTGFDCPSIDTVILNRSTQSLILYLQMIGRGARISTGKKDFKVLDLGRSEEHTSELQSRFDLVCRLLLEKKKNTN